MKANPNIDELLCSFVDGELPARQQTEVQRLVARDPEVGRRLRQLQNCRTLIGALPRAEAPGELLEQVKLAVERKTLLAEQPASGVSTAGVIHLLTRRFLAAAAMIALLGVLGFVVYQIVAPVPNIGDQSVARTGERSPTRPGVTRVVVADSGLSGRLEIRTGAVAQADAVLKHAVEQNGLSALAASDDAAGVKTYKLVSSLITSLQSVWPSFDNVTLQIEEPGQFAASVTVDGVTPEQAASIVASKNTAASMQAARNYAVINAIARHTPGRGVLETVRNDAASVRDLVTIDDKVWITKTQPETSLTPPQGEPNVSLTIVLLHTR
jgi:anti-sigma factor RsiW